MTYETYTGTIGSDVLAYLEGIVQKYPLQSYCIAKISQYEYIVAIGEFTSADDVLTGSDVEVYTYNTRAESEGSYSYISRLSYEIQDSFELTYVNGILYTDVLQKGALVSVESFGKQEVYQEVLCVGVLAVLLYLVVWNIFKSICS